MANVADGRSGRMEAAEKAPSPGRPARILQPDVPIVRDPERVRHLAAEKREENESLRRFLKSEGPPEQLVDRLFCPIVFSVLERLKAELLERGYNWRAGSASTLPAQ